MKSDSNARDLDKAAQLGDASYVWRMGQRRRFRIIQEAAGVLLEGCILENGCGIGIYIERLSRIANTVIGLEFDHPRAVEARQRGEHILNATGENLPFPDNSFDIILSHEVIEHIHDDKQAISEIVRALRTGGRLILFCPNRGYPFETHGIFLRGRYRFGNIPIVNYLPHWWRDKLAPHVRVYTKRDLNRLFENKPVRIVSRTIIFGAYDNIIARWPNWGRFLRAFLQGLENTPLRIFGLSHVWVVEKL